LSSNEPYEFRKGGTSHYLALHDMVLNDGELRIDGLPRQHTRNLRDTITFVPKGCAIEGWCAPVERANSFTVLYFDPEDVREDLGAKYAQRDISPFAYSRDPQLRLTLSKLEAVLRRPEVDELHAEGICLLASLEVFGAMADPGGRLSDRQLNLVIDFIEANLQHGIGLAELAGVAGLSRFHFSRAFKATTGTSPHAFVQKRKIERACSMLADSDLPIEAIAAAVGFKGASQFRRVFGEIVGLSPVQYRRYRG
ncbi:MAG: AraC family transcriptional regulator, partial [Hyphomicrobiales bacterium]